MNSDVLKGAITTIMDGWTATKRASLHDSGKTPLAIVALAEFIHCQCPHIYRNQDGSRCLKGGNDRIVWFDKHFPRGVTSFTVPLCGRVEGSLPNAMYESIQGSTIYITRWDLMLRGSPLKCVECDDGLLFQNSIDTTKMASILTPVFSFLHQGPDRLGIRLHLPLQQMQVQKSSVDRPSLATFCG
jgi:hypothetical protein